jgi:chloramphenicol 3-O phosphotransferase
MRLPDLILLNGSSSAGKTSICKALQEQLPEGYFHFSVDDVFGWTPLRWHRSGEAFKLVTLPNGETPIVTGPEGFKIMRAWRHMVRAALDQGVRALVDDVFTDGGTWDEWAAVLAGKDVLLVGVRCELAELQRREAARGDRGVGQALWQYERVHAQGPYDLEVDTTSASPETCAATIIEALQRREPPGVLARPQQA